MESTELDLNLAEKIVKRAIEGGADEAEVSYGQGYETNVRLRKGQVELLSEAQPKALSLRLYRDKRAAVVYTSDLSQEALEKLVEQALDLATVADPDPAGGLPDPADLARSFPDESSLQIFDPAVGDIPTEIKVEMLRRSEDTAFGYDKRINNSEGASFSTRLREVGLVNSLGFAGSYRVSSCGMSMNALAEGEDGKKQIGGWYSRSHGFKSLIKPEELGKIAAQRAVGKIGGRKVATRKVPVIFEPLMAAELLDTLESAVVGSAYERRATFLLGREGQQIGSNLVTVVDDPTRPGLPSTRPFDGEGVTARRNPILTQGVFEGFLFNTYTARKTGRHSTGSATGSSGSLPGVGSTNFYIEAGTSDPAEMIAGVQDGLYLTEMIGHGFNTVTGDFSRGASGFWIEGGKLTYPVAEISIAGNLGEMLTNVSQVGNDLVFLFGTASPTLRIDNVMVSGL